MAFNVFMFDSLTLRTTSPRNSTNACYCTALLKSYELFIIIAVNIKNQHCSMKVPIKVTWEHQYANSKMWGFSSRSLTSNMAHSWMVVPPVWLGWICPDSDIVSTGLTPGRKTGQLVNRCKAWTHGILGGQSPGSQPLRRPFPQAELPFDSPKTAKPGRAMPSMNSDAVQIASFQQVFALPFSTCNVDHPIKGLDIYGGFSK